MFLPNDGRERDFSIRIANLSTAARSTLRLVLFGAGAEDEIEAVLNAKRLNHGTIDDTWKDPQILSPRPQPNSGGTGHFAVNPEQKLRRIAYEVNPAILRDSLNDLRIRVLHRGPYPPASEIKVEKIEIEMKHSGRPDAR